MKYKMFRNLLLVGAALSVAGGVLYWRKGGPGPDAVQPAAALPAAASAPSSPAALPSPPPAASPPAAAPAARAARGEGTPLRDVDRELLRIYQESKDKSRRGTGKGSAPKVKDVFPDRPYKINLYEEDGRLARAKLDLNRNGKWDEKWTFAPGRGDVGDPVVKRQVSPTDDDTNYPLAYKLAGQTWVADNDAR